MLKNISLRHDPIEDRLVLRLVLQAAGEVEQTHWLHLTRRVCAKWRLDMQAMSDLSAQPPERLDASAKAVVAQGHHQAMASQVKTRIEPATQAPVPSQAPTLVTKIDCGRRRADRRWVINFERQAQPALGLVLTDATLHGLIDALARRVNNAGWNLQPLALEAVASANLQIATQLH